MRLPSRVRTLAGLLVVLVLALGSAVITMGSAVYFGDVVPTTRHLRAAYNMAYDLDPYQTMARKLELLERACDDSWLVVWDHDPDVAVGRVVRDQRGEFAVVPVHPIGL